jgi:NADH dehydrogenase
VAEYDVVIVGGGFGGAFTARSLERHLQGRPTRILLVSKENFLLFAPVLPEAASGTLEPRHAIIPLREMLRLTQIVTGQVENLDLETRTVSISDLIGQRLDVSYKTLVLAPGAVPSTLEVPGLYDHAVGFKTLPDAIWLRNRVLQQLEAAEATNDPDERRTLLTFTFVGGGYAGVEGLAELESLAHDASSHYRRVTPEDMRWVLVEAADSLLPGISGRLARYTERQLRRRGIEIHLSTRLESCLDGKVVLSDPTVAPYDSPTIVWTAGQRPNPLAAEAGLPVDERNRVVVDEELRVSGHTGVFALGDCAAVPNRKGSLSPATAQHAMREGLVCGRNVAADLGVGTSARFTYGDRGLAVTLGNGRGTAEVYHLTFTGFLAWWMGRSYHLLMMPGLARRARVVSDWTIGLLFPRDTSQFGEVGPPPRLPPPPAS